MRANRLSLRVVTTGFELLARACRLVAVGLVLGTLILVALHWREALAADVFLVSFRGVRASLQGATQLLFPHGAHFVGRGAPRNAALSSVFPSPPCSNRRSSMVPDSHLDLVTGVSFAHVATIGPHGEPQSTPVWIDGDATSVRFSQTTDRQKYRNVQREPRVAMSIIDLENRIATSRSAAES